MGVGEADPDGLFDGVTDVTVAVGGVEVDAVDDVGADPPQATSTTAATAGPTDVTTSWSLMCTSPARWPLPPMVGTGPVRRPESDVPSLDGATVGSRWVRTGAQRDR